MTDVLQSEVSGPGGAETPRALVTTWFGGSDMAIVKRCPECGQEFSTYPSQPRVFCSRQCRGAATSLERRFWSYVGAPNEHGCLLWDGPTNGDGYGVLKVRGADGRWRGIGAHRLSWEMNNGDIPEGMHVLHDCDARYLPGDITNRRCVNHEHLFLGTQSINAADCHSKGRGAIPSRCPLERIARGERTGAAKLTESKVRLIRARLQAGHTQRSVALEMGVHLNTIRKIAYGQSWGHLR